MSIKDILKQIKSLIKTIKQSGDITYIKESLDQIYKNIKEINPEDKKYNKLISEIEFLESYISNIYLINADTNLTKKELKKIKETKMVTDQQILDFVVLQCRSKMMESYTLYGNQFERIKDFDKIDVTNMCKSMTLYANDIFESYNIKCEIIRLNHGFVKDKKQYPQYGYHYFAIVTINDNKYIFDTTYKQFFNLYHNSIERMGVVGLSGCNPGIYMIQNEERKKLAEEIITKGYIKLTKENLKNYLDGFALSYRNENYYTETNEIKYITQYTYEDYMDFLFGEDDQIQCEGEENLGRLEKDYF